MKKGICDKCNVNMELIDEYSQFLEPDEMQRYENQQKINTLVSKLNNSFITPRVNIEIYKCSKCGEYKGIEYA